MPNFYNTAAPTSSAKNTINSIVLDYGIRDFLLNKNLAPVYPFLSTSLNGSPRIGEPVLDTMVGTGNITQPFGLPLETEGILRMEIAILPNQFKDQSSTAGSLVSVENISSAPIFNANWPQGIQSYGASGVYQYGLMGKTIEKEYLKKATIKNLYLDASKQVDGADWITLETLPVTQQVSGYLDVYGGLNIGGSAAIQASSVIGSVLNGQGLGLAKGGIVTNYDLRSSLAGRILGATGLINDTKLGMIGGQQLALALANNAAFNVTQAALGALNVQDNVMSLVKNGTLAGFRPNYQITVPSGNGGKILDYTAKILGFTLPKSYLEDSGSIFADENGNSENISRANSMILNTGKGQVVALLTNVRANLAANSIDKQINPYRTGYAPGFSNNKGEQEITDGIIYAFGNGEGHLINPLGMSDGRIPDMSYMRDQKIEDSGFSDIGADVYYGATGPFSPNKFTWTTPKGGLTNTNVNFDISTADPKSLLAKTQKLFNSKGMMNIVSSKGDMNVNTPSQIQSAVVGGGISHGNAVLGRNSFNRDGQVANSFKSADETYCRSWTTFDRYDKVINQVRRGTPNDKASSNGLYSTVEGDGNLDAVSVPYRFNTEGSILDKYGNPQIAPYSTDSKADPKKYMFSIENLAWNDNVTDLLPCEVGPGDLISGKKGRIMWFPPYNIQFSENTNVTWESNQFIGRGESVYTYSNSERGGTLSFQIIVDHPSYVNSFKGSNGPDDHYVASFFAGCVDPTKNFADKLTVSEINTIVAANITVPQEISTTPQIAPKPFTIYFPNDVDAVPSTYENGLSGASPSDLIDYSVNGSGSPFGLGEIPGSFTSTGPWVDKTNFGFNGQKNIIKVGDDSFSGITDPLFISYLNEYLTEKCPTCVVSVQGFASKQGQGVVNTKLANARADSVIATLRPQLFVGMEEKEKDKRFKKIAGGEITDSSCVAKGLPDTEACKKDRKAVVSFKSDPALLPKSEIAPEPTLPKPEPKNVVSQIRNRFYTECNYFEQLTDKDNFVFDSFRQKIKYFHPAFHSTTPEGLNSRLTFLNQCTRQGPTLEKEGANNLAFGRPPVCILRIGDFYNTKIIIESLGIDFEPLVWDLNPEGVGVQPMIANVNLSFKFIGGSTLQGPINKLQNALSFNYYANTQVYDPRADYIAKDPNGSTRKVMTANGTERDIPPYMIVDGIKNMNPTTNTIPSQSEVKGNTPQTNQPAAASNATDGSSKQVQPVASGSPTDDISRIALNSAENINNGLRLQFIINGTTDLSSDYDFRATLTDNDKITKEIGVKKILKTFGIQEFDFTGVVSDLTDGKPYFILVKIGTSTTTLKTIFNYTSD